MAEPVVPAVALAELGRMAGLAERAFLRSPEGSLAAAVVVAVPAVAAEARAAVTPVELGGLAQERLVAVAPTVVVAVRVARTDRSDRC